MGGKNVEESDIVHKEVAEEAKRKLDTVGKTNNDDASQIDEEKEGSWKFDWNLPLFQKTDKSPIVIENELEKESFSTECNIESSKHSENLVNEDQDGDEKTNWKVDLNLPSSGKNIEESDIVHKEVAEEAEGKLDSVGNTNNDDASQIDEKKESSWNLPSFQKTDKSPIVIEHELEKENLSTEYNIESSKHSENLVNKDQDGDEKTNWKFDLNLPSFGKNVEKSDIVHEEVAEEAKRKLDSFGKTDND